MNNGDSKKPDEKPSEGQSIPFSEFTFFDDIPSSEFPWSSGSVTAGVPGAVVDVLERRLSHPHRDALLKSMVNAKPKGDPHLNTKNAVALKRYPHVLAKLDSAWWSPELFHLHLSKFSLTEERADPNDPNKIIYNREWFPKEVADELAMLTENHDRLFWLPPHLREMAHIKDPFSHNHGK